MVFKTINISTYKVFECQSSSIFYLDVHPITVEEMGNHFSIYSGNIEFNCLLRQEWARLISSVRNFLVVWILPSSNFISNQLNTITKYLHFFWRF